jgi:SAM-dependent methyltransferase
MAQKKAVVEHFEKFAEGDRWSDLYDEQADPLRAYNFVVRRQRVQELSEEAAQPGARVLDIGCGTAIMAPHYLERGCEYFGTDIAPHMIEAAEQRVAADRAHFSVGDVERGLDFPDGHFDLIIALGLVEYLDDLDPAAAEIARLARPGGTIIVSAPHRRCVNHMTTRILSPIITPLYAVVKRLLGKTSEPHTVHHRRFIAREMEALFDRHGCHKTGGAYYNLEVLFYPLYRLLPRLAHRVKRWAEPHQGSWMRVFATGYILRCQRAAGSEQASEDGNS